MAKPKKGSGKQQKGSGGALAGLLEKKRQAEV
jgi:hypothetical protein